MSIAYFVHELADAAVHKRVRMLSMAGQTVALLGFERDRGHAGAAASPGVVLGRTRNRRLLARALSVMLAVPRALRAGPAWREAQVIVARNLEMLALVAVITRLAGAQAKIVYECLDIHALMLSRGPAGAMMRALERACLSRAALIVTSSPAFEQRYFRARQHFKGKVVIAENKVLAAIEAPMAAHAEPPPWVVAWCGVLRCRRSFELLRRAAERHPVRVELWGAPALDQIPDFHQAVAAAPNLSYHGPYSPDQLPDIYARAHFSWAADFYESGGNSDWLLPNRLYESLCYGAAPIAVEGVETARWLQRHDVGVVLPAPIEQALETFLESLTAEHYRRLHDATLRLEPEATRFTPEACRAFAAELAGAPA